MRFVIIASSRTGSSHLVNLLGGHPEIFCHGNVFAQHMMAVFWPKRGKPPASEIEAIKAELRELRNRDPDAFLEHMFSIDHGRPHVGFKIFRGQNDDIADKLIVDSSVRKIVLYRRNILANYSSAMIASKNHVWDVQKGEVPPPSKLVFDEEQFVVFHNNYVRYYRHVISSLNGHGQDFHFLGYDEINDPSLFESVANFIGADGKRAVVQDDINKIQVRQNTPNILNRFSNPETVERFLSRVNRLHWSYEGETSIAVISRSTRKAAEFDQAMIS